MPATHRLAHFFDPLVPLAVARQRRIVVILRNKLRYYWQVEPTAGGGGEGRAGGGAEGDPQLRGAYMS